MLYTKESLQISKSVLFIGEKDQHMKLFFINHYNLLISY